MAATLPDITRQGFRRPHVRRPSQHPAVLPGNVRSSADPVDVLAQSGPICASQSMIVEDLATAHIGGSASGY